MARAYSLDFRERVVAQVARSTTHQAVADLNGIVSSTVTKWCGRKRQSGTPAGKPMSVIPAIELIDSCCRQAVPLSSIK